MERERERDSVCVTEIGRDRECSLNIYFLISDGVVWVNYFIEWW